MSVCYLAYLFSSDRLEPTTACWVALLHYGRNFIVFVGLWYNNFNMIWRNLFIYSVFLRFDCDYFILFYCLYDLFSFGMFHCNTSLCWLNCLFHSDKLFSSNSLVFFHCLFLCFRVMIQILAFQNLLITWHYWPPGHIIFCCILVIDSVLMCPCGALSANSSSIPEQSLHFDLVMRAFFLFFNCHLICKYQNYCGASTIYASSSSPLISNS